MSNTKLAMRWASSAALLWAASCASTPGAKPDDMSAQEHRETAAREQAQGEAHEARYDPGARTEGAPATDASGRLDPQYYNPTAEHLRHARTHREHAADHEAAAEELEAFEEEECGRFAPEVRGSCPLLGKVASVEDIEEPVASAVPPAKQAGTRPEVKRGVRIHFAPGVDTDAAAAHMRCHLAFARKMGRKGMDHCPLYVEGVAIERSASESPRSAQSGKRHSTDLGKDLPGSKAHESRQAAKRLRVEKDPKTGTIDLLVDDPALLDELRKRVREHMPHGD